MKRRTIATGKIRRRRDAEQASIRFPLTQGQLDRILEVIQADGVTELEAQAKRDPRGVPGARNMLARLRCTIILESFA